MYVIGFLLILSNMDTLQVVCYNMFGFNNGFSALNDLCTTGDIIVVEEHWLAPYNLDKLLNFHPSFEGFCWSAMCDKVHNGILKGRPFGGLGILVKKNLDLSVSVLGVMPNCRCAALKCVFPTGYTVILIAVYFPHMGVSGDYVVELSECLGFIDHCLHSSNYHDVIILGDMNFDCKVNSVGFKMFNSLCDDFSLNRADKYCGSDINYTYMQETTNNNSVIDHIFVSQNLSTSAKKYFAFDNIVNLSDHLPIGCDLLLDCRLKYILPSREKQCRYKRRWDKADLAKYYSNTYELLSMVTVPHVLLQQKCDVFQCAHWKDINEYYNAIVSALSLSMDGCVPLCNEHVFRSFWDSDLSDLKQASLDANSLWLLCDKPRSGVVNRIRLTAKYKYKRALKQAMLREDQDLDDEISNLYMQKDMNQFWQKWNSKFSNKHSSPSVINGVSGDRVIADIFCDNFSGVYFDSYKDDSLLVDFMEKLHCKLSKEYESNCFLGSTLFDVVDIEASLNCLKNGKASGPDGLTKENMIYAHPSIIIHLKLLFNMICVHGFVPDNFGHSVTVPVVKDKTKDMYSADNYRPIALSPIISKIFEYCIFNKYKHLFVSDNLQFGFKKNLSCSHAIFVLTQVVDYFISHGSNVYLASLDATKAFDRVHHIKLFNKLSDLDFPAGIIKVLFDWYCKTFTMVRWKNSLSRIVQVRSGIRQGGILSPFLFNIYINSIITALKSADLGCHIDNMFVGCIAYADDIMLLSASVVQLNKMLDICLSQGEILDVRFNSKKSCLFTVGKDYKDQLASFNFGDGIIAWDSMRYLGINFNTSKRLKIDICPFLRKFYASVNAIIARSKFVNEDVKLRLFESFSLPLMTYGLNVVSLSCSQLNKLNSAWNNVYRKIFCMKPWESVKELQILCGRLDLKHLIDLSKMRFYRSVSTYSTDVLRCCLSKAFRLPSVKNMFYYYGVSTGCCVGFDCIFNKLKTLVS